jgi:hypothetical protein
MASSVSRSSQKPRGSSVWVGLDPFGDAAVERLARWFGDSEEGAGLAAANRLLPGVRIDAADLDGDEPGAEELRSDVLLEPDELDEPEPPPDVAAQAIQDALATLLAAQQSREALAWADREVLVPHVWLVADLDSAETKDLASWTARLHDRFKTLKVEARVLLLVRYLSWGRPDAALEAAAERCRLLVETLVGETTPGRTNVLVYMVTDRDGIGGRYSEEETSGLLHRALDLLLLADLAHSNLPGTERAFQPPPGGGPGGWDTLPVFGSVAGACLLWDAPALARENAERRRKQLFDALASPVPATYEPAWPELELVRLADAGAWPQLDVPTWIPRFWKTPKDEYQRYRDLVDAWERRGTEWRHAMLVTHRDRKANLGHRAAAAYAGYTAELDSRERSVLDDPSLNGFFAPLHRLYDRATADLLVRRDDARAVTRPADSDLDPVEKIKRPDEVMGGADELLIRRLEHKINPALLAQVTVMTIGIAWFLVAYVLSSVAGWLRDLRAEFTDRVTTLTGPGRISLPEPIQELWNQLVGTGVDPVQAAREIAEQETYKGVWDSPWFVEKVEGLSEILPSSHQIILWTGLLTVIPLLAIAVFLALRQRVVIERGWNKVYRQAHRWRDEPLRILPKDIESVEAELIIANIDGALEEVARRRVRLEEFEAIGQVAVSDAPPPDDAVTGHIRPARPTPMALSPLLVSRIVAVFKRECSRLPSDQWTAERLLDQLFADAADQASDPEIDLRTELPLLRRRVLTSMPPDGAVRVQQLDSRRRAEFGPERLRISSGILSGSPWWNCRSTTGSTRLSCRPA